MVLVGCSDDFYSALILNLGQAKVHHKRKKKQYSRI